MPHRRPEILEADLAPLALELATWGAEPGELRWLDAPPEAAYAQATELLGELEALDPGGVTGHGRRMAAFGLHPRLAHMLLRGEEMGRGAVACDLAALLGSRDVLEAEGRAPDADLRLRVEALAEARRGGRTRVGTIRGQRVHRGRLRRALREARHLGRKLGTERHGRSSAGASGSGSAPRGPGGSGPGEADGEPPAGLDDVGLLTAFAYPDRIGRRREGQRGRFLLRNGRGARFAELQPLAGVDWLVAAEVEGRGREARIFRAARLEPSDVEAHFGTQIDEVEEVVWDGEAGRVRARRRRVLGALTLHEAPLARPDPGAVTGALLEGIRQEGLDVLPWGTRTRQLRERLAFLHHLDPEGWPDVSDDALEASLEEWLAPFLTGSKSLDDLRRLDLAEALMSGLGWERRARLDDLAPTHLEVPSGSRIPVDYSDPEAPALAVRLQEVFGLTDTPRLAGGRVPVTMKLLSPAQRPVQITTDLESFWRDAYFEVRKDMRGRYPKHYWPEDPLEAEPTRRTKPNR